MNNCYRVSEFCDFVESDLNGFIQEISGISRNVTDEEKKAMTGSYPVVSAMLKKAIAKQPAFADAKISSTNLLVEYKLPAASAWCDLVLLGEGYGSNQVIIIELKNYQKNNNDEPGLYEGLMIHKGETIKHPADQVKGYTEYCRNFHSAVLDNNAEVNGCVYFTQSIDLTPYEAAPNNKLSQDYKLYNRDCSDALSEFVISKIQKGNDEFAAEFINGYYKQNRNILKQVAENLGNASSTVRPFVLLDEQRLGFNQVMGKLEERINDGKKEVIVVVGPPGSGKSAVAINLWIEAVNRYSEAGNIVFVTTSGSQSDNWSSIFDNNAKHYHAHDLILKANAFNPGLNGSKMKNELLPRISRIHPEYVNPDNPLSLQFKYFREYLAYMQENGMTKNYKPNLHFLSVVDEAHALINPCAEGFRSNKTAGWCFQMGPQVYHIINESQVSVFLTDSKQSFRDNESTSIDDIKKYAEELGATVTLVSLDDLQFRCAGSKEYVEWVDGLFLENPIRNAKLWKNKFSLNIVDSPFKMESYLQDRINEGNSSVRILSSYTRKWVSPKELNAQHSNNAPYDFQIEDEAGTWSKYWNNPERYSIFVQADKGSMMANNPLSEVGCPYVVRGFDFDHVGILWLDDIFVRDGKWYMSVKNIQETAIGSTRNRAVNERKEALKAHIVQGIQSQIDILPAYDKRFPAATELFKTVAQAYRILLTRGIKSVTLFIKDEETRYYIQNLLSD